MHSTARRLLAVLLLTLALGGPLACGRSHVANLEGFDELPLNRVVPYPSAEERRIRAHAIRIVEGRSAEIDEELLAEAQRRVQRRLEGIAEEAGALVIDEPAEEDTAAERTARKRRGRRALQKPDLEVSTRFAKHHHFALWRPPIKLPWQTDEEVAGRSGICTHVVEIELELTLVGIDREQEFPTRIFVLTHSSERKAKQLESSCPIESVALGLVFEKAIDEAMSCLELPLGTLLLPRGHVLGHRLEPEAERHVYRISLGREQGIEVGERVEILREQRAVRPSGEQARFERLLATGVVTSEIREEEAWVAAEPGMGADEILKGDVVRPILEQGLLSSLSGPQCGRILEER
ncbi:MAG: hypothetical protein JRF61_07235 [Deltaproteobacteria bacterium]|nr:hypothetical protein [Deltaproteobacteria bacterium]